MAPEMPSIEEVRARIDMPFDTGLLERSGFVLTRETLTRDSALGLKDVFVPWHTRRGLPVIHRKEIDQTVFPQVVRDYPRRGDATLTIENVVESAAPAHPWLKPGSIRSDPPPTGWYPAYDVGQGRRLLLDGNHRCISIVKSGIDYSVDLIVVSGPVRSEILPDLAVFESADGSDPEP